MKLAKTPTNITKISKKIWYSFKSSFWIFRWKTAGKLKATQEPLKLSMNDIKSAKCGIEIAGRSVRKFVNTRMPMNQTISGHLNGSELTEKISSIVWIMVMTLKGYEKRTFKIKNPLTKTRKNPMGRLFAITSGISGLNDRKAQTEKTILRIVTKV